MKTTMFVRCVVTILLISIWIAAHTIAPACGHETTSAQRSADLVLTNGQICTMDNVRSWCDSVAIADGGFIAVGARDEVLKYAGPSTRIIDLKGKMVMPGFQDCHAHPMSGGMTLYTCDLSKCNTRQEALNAIKSYVKSHRFKKGEWLLGGRWSLTVFPQANPTKEMLDKILPDVPAFLEAQDGHSAWVNSAALRIANINKQTPDPPRGRIERAPNSREPSGTLREAAASLVSRFIPATSEEERAAVLREGLKVANSYGITSIQDACVEETELKAYSQLQSEGKLTARIIAAQVVDAGKGPEQIAEFKRLRAKYAGTLLKATSAKLFLDGVMETTTAGLLEPYIGKGKPTKGMFNYSPAHLNDIVQRLDAEGFQIHMHSIGDGAVREGLDSIAYALKKNGKSNGRHHLAHLELIAPSDIPRFRNLGVAANFQSIWAYHEAYISMTEPMIGKARSSRLYPMRSVHKSGALMVAGSDWPVTSLNPMEAIQVAVTRRDPSVSSGPSWLPAECMDLPDVLSAYTINGAYINHQETTTGSIEPNKFADLIVLDKNIFAIPLGDIHKVKVLWTLLSGNEVYRAANFTPGS